MKKAIFFSIFVFNFTNILLAQAPIYDISRIRQFKLLNPASIGLNGGSEIGIDYLLHNGTKDEKWTTFAVTADYYLYRIKSSVGINAIKDTYLGNGNDYLSLSGLYSYKIRLNRKFVLNSGIELGFIENKLNNGFVNRYNFETTIFQNYQSNFKENMLDISAGLLLYSSRNILGFSMNHINQPIEATFDKNKIRLPSKYTLIAGHIIPIRNRGRRTIEMNKFIRAMFTYQYQDERYYIDSTDLFLIDPTHLSSFILQYKHSPFQIGASYKNINLDYNLFSAHLGFNFSDLDINYNYSFSANSNIKTNIHQISLGWKFNTYVKLRRRSRAVSAFGGSYSPSFRFAFTTSKNYIPESTPQKGNILLDTTKFNTEEYDRIYENPFLETTENPLSTFSIDVDNASYSNCRRFIEMDSLPPADAVRIEEFINYFNYNYPQPQNDLPFSITSELGKCPWNEKHDLLHIGLQGKELDYVNLKPSNLVFLIDVSGSMDALNKLSLAKKSLAHLVDNLNEKDKVAIVVYAGAAGLILKSTPASDKNEIKSALKKLEAGGPTAGGQGIKLAYKIAKENLIENGNNRVILMTDGDFNVGTSSTSELVRLIEEKRKDDIYLTICGFGMGNYKDGSMEQISNAGNGNYFYIDNFNEAQKVFGKELRANMFIIAKDVKFQLEFNPHHVKAYRLIGYENRVLNKEDFNDDTKDAGELGAGHTVTALYEIIPAQIKNDSLMPEKVDELRYQKTTKKLLGKKDELLTLKLRYKNPKDTISNLITNHLKVKNHNNTKPSENFRFTAAVAQYGLILRNSKYKGSSSFTNIKDLSTNLHNNSEYRKEFINLVNKTEKLFEKKQKSE